MSSTTSSATMGRGSPLPSLPTNQPAPFSSAFMNPPPPHFSGPAFAEVLQAVFAEPNPAARETLFTYYQDKYVRPHATGSATAFPSAATAAPERNNAYDAAAPAQPTQFTRPTGAAAPAVEPLLPAAEIDEPVRKYTEYTAWPVPPNDLFFEELVRPFPPPKSLPQKQASVQEEQEDYRQTFLFADESLSRFLQAELQAQLPDSPQEQQPSQQDQQPSQQADPQARMPTPPQEHQQGHEPSQQAQQPSEQAQQSDQQAASDEPPYIALGSVYTIDEKTGDVRVPLATVVQSVMTYFSNKNDIPINGAGTDNYTTASINLDTESSTSDHSNAVLTGKKIVAEGIDKDDVGESDDRTDNVNTETCIGNAQAYNANGQTHDTGNTQTVNTHYQTSNAGNGPEAYNPTNSPTHTTTEGQAYNNGNAPTYTSDGQAQTHNTTNNSQTYNTTNNVMTYNTTAYMNSNVTNTTAHKRKRDANDVGSNNVNNAAMDSTNASTPPKRRRLTRDTLSEPSIPSQHTRHSNTKPNNIKPSINRSAYIYNDNDNANATGPLPPWRKPGAFKTVVTGHACE